VLLQSHGTALRAFSDDDPQPEQVVGVRATRALVYSDGLLVEDDETVATEGQSAGVRSGGGTTPVAVGFGQGPTV